MLPIISGKQVKQLLMTTIYIVYKINTLVTTTYSRFVLFSQTFNSYDFKSTN
jgi:hypothetical protein